MLEWNRASEAIRRGMACAMILLAGCGGGGGGETGERRTGAGETVTVGGIAAGGGSSTTGGGSAGDNAGGTGTPPPVEMAADIATESPPVGPQVDLQAAGYLPMVNGAAWTYSVKDAYGNETGTMERSLAQLPSDGTADIFGITTKENGNTYFYTYRKTANGLYSDYSSISGYPPGAARLIGRVREYAFPTYAEGEKRVVLREGTWDEDLDGDGKFERFRFEYSQVYNGLVKLSLPWEGQADTAKFTSTTRISVTTSKTPNQVYGYVSTQEEYGAKHIGWVRAVVRIDDLFGNVLEPARTYAIKTAFVNGTQYAAPVPPAPVPAITSKQVDLAHNELVYDALRSRYYASVPSSVVGNGNSIATIDPHSGAVTYSQAIGSEPKTLSISPDGQYLYVGLEGAGEVVKLALPNMAVLARITLGVDASYGTYFANSIAVSPADSNTFAVSLKNRVSPSHAGVILVNGTVIAPRSTQRHTGSNRIVFGADGTVLYGINDETSEFGLRQITVSPDGLTQSRVVATSGPYNIQNFQYKDGKIYIASRLYSATDLSLLGQFKQNLSLCRPLLDGARTVCPPSVGDSDSQITVHDTNTFVTLSAKNSPISGWDIRDVVPGPGGTIAISYGFGSYQSSPRLYLLTSADF